VKLAPKVQIRRGGFFYTNLDGKRSENVIIPALLSD
jgi:hypothetical protein